MQDILYYETYTPHYSVTLDGKFLHREAYSIVETTKNGYTRTKNFKEEFFDETTYDDRQGYYCVHHYSIHRLVVEAYRKLHNLGPIPPNMAIDHIDTVQHNNDISNLRVCTPKENCNNPLTKKHISESNKGRVFTDEWKKHLSDSCIGRPSSFKGRHHTENTIETISKKNKQYWSTHANPMKGKNRSEDTKKRVSEGTKKAMANLSEDKRQRLREAGYNSRGRIWINREGKCKRVFVNELDYYIKNGWVQGRLGRTINTNTKKSV